MSEVSTDEARSVEASTCPASLLLDRAEAPSVFAIVLPSSALGMALASITVVSRVAVVAVVVAPAALDAGR
ncbi:MAG: hypothetical protein CSB44_06740 [Gammaproteobacteria bacterium]|nr:MAG: hypothetical protein CSB44_06740 [Gammaproteobacteria bacterium]